MIFSALTLATLSASAFFSVAHGHAIGSYETSLVKVKHAFEAANIPQNLSMAFDPTVLLDVQFTQASGSPSVHVSTGGTYFINQTAIPPVFGVQLPESATASVSVHARHGAGHHGKDAHVVAMLDLDAPTPENPIYADILHTIGGNFTLQAPDHDGLALLSNSTPALVKYVQPAPVSGTHRYVFLLFNQPTGKAEETLANYNFTYTLDGTIPIVAFLNFSQFATDTGLGAPIGGSFIYIGADSSSESD